MEEASDYIIMSIYVPTIADRELQHAVEEAEALQRRYGVAEEDFHEIVRRHKLVFERIVQNDPVLRRPPSQAAHEYQFLSVPYERITKEKARAYLARIHQLLDVYGVPGSIRGNFFRRLHVRQLYVLGLLAAELNTAPASLKH